MRTRVTGITILIAPDLAFGAKCTGTAFCPGLLWLQGPSFLLARALPLTFEFVLTFNTTDGIRSISWPDWARPDRLAALLGKKHQTGTQDSLWIFVSDNPN